MMLPNPSLESLYFSGFPQPRQTRDHAVEPQDRECAASVKTREGRKGFLRKSIASHTPCALCPSEWRRCSLSPKLLPQPAGKATRLTARFEKLHAKAENQK